MATLSADERNALAEAVRRLLADHSTEADVRRAMETPEGYDPALWARLSEMGVPGLLVDEAHGGSGAGPLELELIMEQVGAALACSPFLASGVLAASLLQALGDEDANARLLPAIASGKSIATVALTGDQGLWTEAGVDVVVDADGRLTGAAAYVLHAHTADTLLVLARDGHTSTIVELSPTSEGVRVDVLPTFDHTLRLARVTFSAAPARRLTGPAWPAVQAALDHALIALAGEQAGGTRRVLDFTTDYAKTRIQFGRPIGGFQAIKHMAADLLLESESATSAARHAAAKLAAGDADAPAAISLAAFACADAFVTTTAQSIQMHGGIAFTWAHPAHLYLRRARSGAQLFGSSNVHRERYLQQLGG